ncbi:molybdopterin biosynthesis protein [Vulcanibacillus modesticaldus]|uniref:Molybdopterin molybdenumtransferase n=1 Tax=Vulcanibacillus modesticaldus TaxID=337097 RepID=A0A1D2YWB7_9BACI|nr:molybdopterin biosynthesis protein [Vulcanibacillus modesticaldus]OEG00041.1 molybdopterin biosynthesis protein [Vulcanibacillus modesticaldus]
MGKIQLENTPLHIAQEKFISLFNFEPRVEMVRVTESLGRVTAEPIFAKISMPNFHASAMDGIAVKAENTYSAHETTPLRLKLHQDYEVVDTGDPIPEGFDSVIMVEYLRQIDEETVEITEPAVPWKHIRQIGEDIVAGEMLLPNNHKIRPVDQGALLAGGIIEIPVIAKPKVAIIPTGTELVKPTTNLKPGDIIEFNGTVFSSYVQEWGGEPIYKGIIKDDFNLIKQAVEEALEEADIVIMNAGSSKGREDFTSAVIKAIGKVHFHGLATRPGKPVVLGEGANGKPIVGIPGYPVSAYLAMDWFIKPLMHNFQGLATPKRNKIKVKLAKKIVSKKGAEDFIRVTIGKIKEQYIANPLTRSAGVTMTMVKANGLLRIPIQSQGYEQGEEVEVELYRPIDEVEKMILFAGSHDLTIDLLNSVLKRIESSFGIKSSNIGSLAGILAIGKGENHVAGINLLDEKTGEYNISFVKQHLRDESIVLINLAYRQQGWIVQKGNPKNIKTIEDLKNTDIRYINRQFGAGTRVLFDYLLKRANMLPDDIYGYEREDYSHLSLAAAIKGESADVGLGILSAAQVMGLEFIPVVEERFDLVMTKQFYESDAGQTLLKAINSKDFKSQVEAMGGYSCRDTGKIMFQN